MGVRSTYDLTNCVTKNHHVHTNTAAGNNTIKTHLGHAQFALAWRLLLEVWWSCSSRARTRSRTVSCLCARLVCPTALAGLEIEAAGGAGHRPRAVVLGCMSPKNTFSLGLLRSMASPTSTNSLTVRQSLDWPLWSGHFPTSFAGRKGSSGLLAGCAEAGAVYVPRTKPPLAPTKRRA